MKKYLVIKHRVRDYGQWKKVFDERRSIVQPYGLSNFEVCCDIGDRNTVYVIHEFADEQKAQELMKSPELKEAMEQSGVIGEPEIMFLEQLASEVPEADRVEADREASLYPSG